MPISFLMVTKSVVKRNMLKGILKLLKEMHKVHYNIDSKTAFTLGDGLFATNVL